MIAIRLIRDGAVAREAVFRTLPVSIGRSPESDFPILDDSVSLLHARIERDEQGTLHAVDLGSKNGLHVGPLRVAKAAIERRLRCNVGTVEVEIEAWRTDDTREIALHDWRRLERRRGLGTQLLYLSAGVLGWVAAVAIEPSFWSPWTKGRGIALVGHALGALIALPLGGAALLVLLKAFARRLRLADTLAALATVVWLSPAEKLIAYLLYYPLPAATHAAFKALLLVATASLAVTLLASLRRVGAKARFRAGWFVATAALIGGALLTSGLSSKKEGEPDLDFRVQAPLGSWPGRSESLDDYVARIRRAAGEAETEASTVRAKLAQ